MKKEIKNIVNNKVILNLIQDLQRLLLLFINDMRGRSQIKFGMTSLFNNGAFTLIELLVVVLIIGILAAVAVPQYQKAVDKSTATQMLVTGKAIKDAQEVYYVANGEYATSRDQLDVDINMVVQLYNCVPSATPAAAYVYHPKNNHIFIVFGYQHQCSNSGWNNARTCYASGTDTQANRFCANLAHTTPKSGCGQYCTYDLSL